MRFIITVIFLLAITPSVSRGAQERSFQERRLSSGEFAIILQEIKNLREDMNKRFEQVDKRFEFIQLLLLALLGVVIGTSIYSVLRDRRVPGEIKSLIETTKKNEIMIREVVERDPKLLEHFKNIGLL